MFPREETSPGGAEVEGDAPPQNGRKQAFLGVCAAAISALPVCLCENLSSYDRFYAPPGDGQTPAAYRRKYHKSLKLAPF